MSGFSFLNWPVVRQFRSSDPLGRGEAVMSQRTKEITPRTSTADRVVQSVCPYCAVGCGQKVFVKDEKVVQIEGDPDSPISRGRLCPKVRPANSWSTRPGGRPSPLPACLRERLAGTGIGHRHRHGGRTLPRSPAQPLAGHRRAGPGLAPHHGHRRPGCATLDNEENYLIKKLFTAAGAVQLENQARI